jgi:beta-glucosidase
MQRSTAVTTDGVHYRDLNRNGVLDPFEDPRLPATERVADLLPRLSLAEKAGLLFHWMVTVGAPGAHDVSAGFSRSTPRELVLNGMLSHFNVSGLPSARQTARWQNAMQQLAEQTPHGIPITFSTDPRHAFTDTDGVSFAAGALSQWPEPLGLAAIGSTRLVRRFADIARQEYLAIGLRAALHPQVDLATEPRWARQAQTFGADSATASELVVAYLEGFQGPDLGPSSVGCTTKHFPGGGSLRDGDDSHFIYGQHQVYPGGRFQDHLAPFQAAIAAGTSAIMPAYGKPVALQLDGEPVEEVAFGFNRRILTGLLREELGYDGVIVTDWGLLTDAELMGKPFPARAWGVEHLSPIERMARVLEAGADQFGGEERTDLVIELVTAGSVPESRIDEAVRRLLLVKFQLGLFDDPYVDEDAADRIVGSAEFREEGHRAQAQSITVLKNGTLPDGSAILPLRPGLRLFVDGVDPEAASRYGTVVTDPADADLAIVRLKAPFELREEFFLESVFHQGSLNFPAEVPERIRRLAATVPVLVDVALDRPAILTPIAEAAVALTADFGASDLALLDALAGRIPPKGRLPFELPRSMAAVEASRPDVPSDTENPLFAHGFGLAFAARGS